MLEIHPRPGIGADVANVDLRTLGNDDMASLRAAFAEHGVLFFRDQALTPHEHIAFASRWGDIDVNRFFTPVPGHPEIAQVSKAPEQTTNIGGGWHTDHSYDQSPALGSILLAREVPPRGGETLFANMNAAFETLSPGLRDMLTRLNAVHSSRHIFGTEGLYAKQGETRMLNRELAIQDAVHPVVIAHPLSGKPTLYVNEAFTLRFDGWTEAESRPLLDFLYRHAARPEFHTCFDWRPGSIAFWDNRATWHYALNNYQGHSRLMHRITVAGTRLERWQP